MEDELKAACRDRTPVIVLALEPPRLCRGRFDRFSERALDLELTEQTEESWFAIEAHCAVVYRTVGRSSCFLATVAAIEGSRLTVRTPEQVASESRSSFRVPILPGAGLQVRLLTEEGWRDVRPIDISMTGILIECPSEVGNLVVRSRIDLELKREHYVQSISGEVRRVAGAARYGVFFPGVIQEGQIEPPPSLERIVRGLEVAWLRERVSPRN